MSGPFGSSQWMYSSGGFYDFPIEQSLKFNDDDSSYLSWTPASAGNRKTWTWSGWVKRGNLGTRVNLFNGGTASYNDHHISIMSSDSLHWMNPNGSSGLAGRLETAAKFRDTSAWYHIVCTWDTTNATASERMRIYINGVRYTGSWTLESYPSQNQDSHDVNDTQLHRIGKDNSNPFDGYMAEVNFIDGQALDASSFGEFKSGVWIPKDPSGLTYGTNGFRLSFQNDTVSEGMNVVTYRGTGTTQSINGLGFEPDFVWMKQRNGTGYHQIFDSVRGVTHNLAPNSTDAEGTITSMLTSFNSDGFSLSTNTDVNGSGSSYVAWCWDAGSGSPVSNTDGSITSTVKANAAYGMSIISYTGTGSVGTIGHGLNSAPEMIIARSRNTVASFITYHEATGNTKYLELNTTLAATTNSSHWNNTSPTSSVFTVGTNSNHNNSGSPCIAYAFHSVAGYSKVGSYSGSGSAGNAITTGFKPAFVMIKRTDTSGADWFMYDNTRSSYNTIDKYLAANTSAAEATFTSLDFNDTGFTMQTGDSALNGSGGTYIYIAFADTRDNAFWRDQSGNGNDWQPNNLTYQDSLPDSTTNNFCVINAVDNTGATLAEGNLRFTPTSDFQFAQGTFACSKNYFEVLFVGTLGGSIEDSIYGVYAYNGNNTTINGAGQIYKDGSLVSSNTAYVAGDILGVAVDVPSNTIQFYRNGSANGSSTLNANVEYMPHFKNASGRIGHANFGQDSSFAGNKPAQGNTDDNGVGDFFYAPPSGYLALAASNLPNPTIDPAKDDVPSDYFNTVTWTGTDTFAGRSVTGVGFSPDLVWTKVRSQAYSHLLYDSVRGTGAAAELSSDQTVAEGGTSSSERGYLNSFDSDGFTSVVGSSSDNLYFNQTSQTYVAWNWLAGNGTSSNTSGSITSTVSVNQKAGFSIVSYTGTGATATFGHGINSAPSMVIIKDRDNGTKNWTCYHKSMGNDRSIFLNLTNAQTVSTDHWQYTNPSSSVVYIGDYSHINTSGNNYISYCFAEVEGFSRFGSYTGNGSTDGPFAYTGFRPAWLLIKRVSNIDHWFTWDSARDAYNVSNKALLPSSSLAEGSITGDELDLLSNGFKLRTTNAIANGSGETYIYMAFAENPFKYANAR